MAVVSFLSTLLLNPCSKLQTPSPPCCAGYRGQRVSAEGERDLSVQREAWYLLVQTVRPNICLQEKCHITHTG